MLLPALSEIITQKLIDHPVSSDLDPETCIIFPARPVAMDAVAWYLISQPRYLLGVPELRNLTQAAAFCAEKGVCGLEYIHAHAHIYMYIHIHKHTLYMASDM